MDKLILESLAEKDEVSLYRMNNSLILYHNARRQVYSVPIQILNHAYSNMTVTSIAP